MAVHGELGQLLAAISLHAGSLARLEHGGEGSPLERAALAGRIGEVARRALALVKELARRGSPGAPERCDLEDALSDLARATESLFGIRVTVGVESPPPILPAECTPLLTAVAREAITNSVVHGGAALVQIRVTAGPGPPRLIIRDDGRGMRTAIGEGMGLSLIREWARAMGGVVSLSNAPGGGVEVALTLPPDGGARPPVDPGLGRGDR